MNKFLGFRYALIWPIVPIQGQIDIARNWECVGSR